ncbi:MAG: 6-phosphofructokinase [Anaerolineae bacterium]|nr:6-phosphofructokinase [Anaerolineae bacterium]
MNTIFVVSGGDAPGINALLANYAQIATLHGDTVCGANGGFPGLLHEQIQPLPFTMLSPWMGRGGSILPSSRDPVLSQAEAGELIRRILHDQHIDNMVLFGGNGTLRYIPPLLRAWEIPYIGIPTTIDNDVPGSERTLGFDSACNFAYQAIDGALATGHALNGRLFMVETLGGTCGNLALAVAQGAGAHAVIVPEFEYDENWLARRLKTAVERDGYGLLVICEGARGARTLADTLPALTGIRMRDTRLGHTQRGGTPSHSDRVLAAQMARLAHHHLKSNQSGILVVRNGELTLTAALSDTPVMPNRELYLQINGLNDEHTGN